jgi:hypothetical protein
MGGHALSHLRHLLDDDPAEGSLDDGVGVGGFRELEVGFGLGEHGGGDLHAALRSVALVRGEDALPRQLLGQPQLTPVLREVGLGPLNGGSGTLDLGLVVAALQPRDDLAFAHPASLLHPQLAEPSLDLGRDHRLAARHDVARGGEDGDPTGA